MIKITYEIYGSDYTRNEGLTKSFSYLNGLHDWILNNYILDTNLGYRSSVIYPSKDRIARLDFRSTKLNTFVGFRWCNVWVHKIEDERGILFTDGKYTDGQKHLSNELAEKFAEWSKTDNAKKEYNFVD